jgi:hypothetical protein
MLRTRAWFRVISILLIGLSATAHAQKKKHEAAPSWETGDSGGEVAAPEAAPPDSERPPDIAAAPDDEVPVDEVADAPSGEQTPIEARANAGVIVGGKVGGGLGVGGFGATPIFELELGFAPDLGSALGRSLEFFFIGQYAQPGVNGDAPKADPRFTAGAPFSYDVTQQMFSMSLGALYRFDVGSKLLMPYAGLGGRLYLLKTKVKADVMGESLGESTETRSDLGLVALGGLDVFVGPGALLGEVSFSWAPLDGYVMRATNLSTLSLAVGYRVML